MLKRKDRFKFEIGDTVKNKSGDKISTITGRVNYHFLGKKLLDKIYKIPFDGAAVYRNSYGIDGFAKTNWAQDFYEEWEG